MNLKTIFGKEKSDTKVEEKQVVKSLNNAKTSKHAICESRVVRKEIKKWLERAGWEYSDFDKLLEKVNIYLPAKVMMLNESTAEMKIESAMDPYGYNKITRKYKIKLIYGDLIDSDNQIQITDEKNNVKAYDLWSRYCIINNKLYNDSSKIQPILKLVRTTVNRGKMSVTTGFYDFFITRKVNLSENVKLEMKYSERRVQGKDYTEDENKIIDYLFTLTPDDNAKAIWDTVSKYSGVVDPREELVCKMYKKLYARKDEIILSAYIKENGVVVAYAERVNKESLCAYANDGWEYYNESHNTLISKNMDEKKGYTIQISLQENENATLDQEKIVAHAKSMANDMYQKLDCINNKLI